MFIIHNCHIIVRVLFVFMYLFCCSTYGHKLSKPSFFLWLEGEVVPKNIPAVNIFDKDKLDKYEVYQVNGRVHYNFDNKSTLIDTNDISVEYMYVLTIDNKLKIVRAEENDIRHVSLTAGEPILSAGNIWIKNGYINKIFFRSGHYRPKLSHYKIMLDYLVSKHFDLTEVSLVQFYEGANISSLTLNDFTNYLKGF